jgi:hypothetical protein
MNRSSTAQHRFGQLAKRGTTHSPDPCISRANRAEPLCRNGWRLVTTRCC